MKSLIVVFSLFGLLTTCSHAQNNGNTANEIIFEDQIWEDGVYELSETLTFEINKDDILDTIKIFKLKDWNDPGDFHKITITLSSGKTYEIYNNGDWIKFEDYELSNFSNKVNSKKIVITNIAENRDMLFISGYSYASTPGKLTIIDLNNGDLKVLFQDYFHLIELTEVGSIAKGLLGWMYYSEYFGYEDSISIGNGYRPYYLLKCLKDTVQIDTVASEIYNYENYLGYFGLAYDDEGRYLTIEPHPYNENVSNFEPYFYFEKYRQYPKTSLEYLTADYFKNFSKSELRIIRNEIFAFHGYKFKSQDLNHYFSKYEWYQPNEKNDIMSRLNKYEKANIQLIKEIENEK